jgi:hypothetical protein
VASTLDPRQPFEAHFALRGRRPFGRPRPPPVLPVGTPTGTGSNPSPLVPQPFPGRPGPERDAPPVPPRRELNQGPRVRGAYRGDCGRITDQDQVPQPAGEMGPTASQAAPRRPHGGVSTLALSSHAPFCGWEVVPRHSGPPPPALGTQEAEVIEHRTCMLHVAGVAGPAPNYLPATGCSVIRYLLARLRSGLGLARRYPVLSYISSA